MKKILNEEKYSIRKKSDIRHQTSDILHPTKALLKIKNYQF